MTTLIPEENITAATTAASKKRKPDTKARVASRRANVAPAQAKSARTATPAKKAPKGRPKREVAKPKNGAKSAKAPRKTHPGPRKESKSAKIFELLARASGATLAELMKATGWQAHSVRGFLSTASGKRGAAIESLKKDQGERVYRIKK